MIMVRAYKKPMKFFLLCNDVLALEDILLLIVHGRILTNIVYDHDLLMLSYIYILFSSYYVGNKLSIYAYFRYDLTITIICLIFH
jgi:hypothetical protein